MTTAEKFAWAISFCHRSHLRLTGPREKILRFLSGHSLPVSIEMMARSPEFAGQCAQTTVYRTLMLLKEIELVRQVGLPKKISYFVLNAPGAVCHYLVCRHCGNISELPLTGTMRRLAQGVASSRGFTSVYYELEVYGVCPACQKIDTNRIPSVKLPIRS